MPSTLLKDFPRSSPLTDALRVLHLETRIPIHALSCESSFRFLSENTLRRAFCNQALKLHPDVPGGDVTCFIRLRESYDLLRTHIRTRQRNHVVNPSFASSEEVIFSFQTRYERQNASHRHVRQKRSSQLECGPRANHCLGSHFTEARKCPGKNTDRCLQKDSTYLNKETSGTAILSSRYCASPMYSTPSESCSSKETLSIDPAFSKLKSLKSKVSFSVVNYPKPLPKYASCFMPWKPNSKMVLCNE